jgi:ankyrin repeat protein
LTVADKGSLLTLAAKQGKADLVEELLRPAIDLNSKDERGRTAMYDNALRAASAEGHDKIVRLLLVNGADVNADGGSALLDASKAGHDRVVRLLLYYGADVKADGGSALLEASKGGHDRVVQLLLNYGADVNNDN